MDNFDHVDPVDITVKHLSVSIAPSWKAGGPKRKRTSGTSLLRNVNVHVPSGQLLAIMGGSGSGKTTFLNAMAGRMNNVSTSGEILINGSAAKEYIASGRVAYVQQNDTLLPYLTVRETLRYAARLRLPNTLSKAEKYKLVEDVILELGLKECADTIVGDEWRKGISGGEKRRVSVGTQLLLNPSVLYMDEPTTGLDSFTSYALVETLVGLCRKGRTICVSIHQPRSDILELFDSIVLLSRGDLVYSGLRTDSLMYFSTLGYEIPDQMNPADFLIDISSVDSRDESAEVASVDRVKRLVQAWTKQNALVVEPNRDGQQAGYMEMVPLHRTAPWIPTARNEGPKPKPHIRIGASILGQTRILAERTFTNLLRDRLTLWGSIVEVMLLATLIGAIFYQLDETESGILGRKSMLYITASVQNYLGLMFMIYKLSLEMKVFDRERLDNMYSITPYLLGWLIANFLLYVVLASLFAVILYFMAGLRTDHMWHLGVFIGSNVLMQFVTIGWAYFCIAWARDFATASLVGNSFFTFLSTSSGFFIQIDQIPLYLRWFKDISYITYGYRLLSTNEYSHNVYSCPEIAGGPKPDPRCEGGNILRSLGFDEDDYGFPIGALAVNYIILMILTGLVLKLKPHGGIKHASTIRKEKSSETDKHILDEESATSPSEIAHPPTPIELQNLSLSLTKINAAGTHTSLPILQSISTVFPASSLSVILGASGAGKSTLLTTLMARPLAVPTFTKTIREGRILYNGMELLDSARVAAICSLVVQDDSYLLPALTAQETLRYAAMLRLPSSMPYAEKLERADGILRELGLWSCKDRIVGGPTVKGLSGGEKRRLSIGVQMLTDPAVLIIDEPTSGLDAYTSHNLMLTLKQLAKSGRTIICSIHQPRSDIFQLFDHILLLARGGRTVYSGAGHEMIPYLASLNHKIPRLTNPADFALDLSSVDLRNDVAEAASRKRVDELVDTWSRLRTREQAKQADRTTRSNLRALEYRTRAPFAVAFAVLIKRSMLNMRRQVELTSARIMQVIALGVIFTLYFARLSTSQPSVQARMGILQQQGSLIFVGMLNCIAIFPQELNLMRHEFKDNIYSVASFFLGYLVNELPFEIVSTLVYSILCMFAVGLQASVEKFFVFAYIVFCLINSGESIGIAFCALVDSVGFSVQIMSTVITVQIIMAGWLSVRMPGFLEGINYVFHSRYVARILAKQEFTGLSFVCSERDITNGTCYYRTGEDVLRLLDFEDAEEHWTFNLVMVAVLTVAVRGLAYAVLWFRTRK